MSITIELTPELEAKITRNAEYKGVSLEDYARLLLENAPPPPEKTLWETLPPDEFAKALRAWSGSHSHWPPLSNEAISRKSIYVK